VPTRVAKIFSVIDRNLAARRSGCEHLWVCATFVGWFAPDHFFDPVERTDAFKRFSVQRIRTLRMQFVELSSGVRPARSFSYTSETKKPRSQDRGLWDWARYKTPIVPPTTTLEIEGLAAD
jgi:hypothetical protein